MDTTFIVDSVDGASVHPSQNLNNPPAQYLSQMKADLPETFTVFQDWSPEWINNVFASAHAHTVSENMYPTFGVFLDVGFF